MGRKILKIFAFAFLGLIGLLLVLFLVLLIPQVQTFVAQKVVNTLTGDLETRFEVGGVQITPFNRVILTDIYIEDQRQDTLLSAQRVAVDINLLNLLTNKVTITSAHLENAFVNIYRLNDADSTFNFQFLADHFASDKPVDTTAAAMEIMVNEVNFTNVRFNMLDEIGYIEIATSIPQGFLDVEEMNLETISFDLNELMLSQAYVNVTMLKLPPGSGGVLEERKEKTKQTDDEFLFSVGLKNLKIEDSEVIYNDLNEKETERGINSSYLAFDSLNAKINDTFYKGMVINADVQDLTVKEKNSGFVINHLAAEVQIDTTQISIRDFNLITPFSEVYHELLLTYNDVDAFEQFVSEVTINANIDNSFLSIKDLAVFVPEVYASDAYKTHPDMQLRFRGNIKGPVNELQGENLVISSSTGAKFSANFTSRDIQDVDNMWIDLNLLRLETSSSELRSLLGQLQLPPEVYRLGSINAKGKFTGMLRDFDTDMTVNTSVGDVRANTTMTLDQEFMPNTYKGRIDVNRLQLGNIMQMPDLGVTDFNARFNGRGIDPKLMQVSLQADINTFDYNNYRYNSVNIDGTFANMAFEGDIVSKDPNLNFNFSGLVDISDSIPMGNFIANVENVDLHSLNLMESPMAFSTKIEADFSGNAPKNLIGDISLTEITISAADESFTVDSFIVAAFVTDTGRVVDIHSEILEASFYGEYDLASLPAAVNNTINYYFDRAKYIPNLEPRQQIAFNIYIPEIPEFPEFLVPGLQALSEVKIEGRIESAKNLIEIDGLIPYVQYNDMSFDSIGIEVNSEADALAFETRLRRAAISDMIQLPNIELSGRFADDDLRLNLAMSNDQDTAFHRIRLEGDINRDEELYRFSLLPGLVLNNQPWDVDGNNDVVIGSEVLYVKNLRITQEGRGLVVNSLGTDEETSPLQITFLNFELGLVSDVMALSGVTFDGMLQGDVTLTDLYDQMSFNAELAVQDLQINEDTLGLLTLNAFDSEGGDRIDIDGALKGSTNDFTLEGFYLPKQKADNVNLLLTMGRLDMVVLSPVTYNFLQGWDGYMAGRMRITGDIAAPDLNGSINLTNATAYVPMLGTRYRTGNNTIQLSTKTISFPQFDLYDSLNNTANLSGTIHHSGFTDMRFDLNFNTNKFYLADAETGANEIFYGTAVVTSTIDITGTPELPRINMTLAPQDGTDLTFYPPAQEDAIRADFYRWINIPPDEGEEEKEVDEYVVSLEGIALDARIQMIDEAQFSVVIDPQGTDALTVRGNGDMYVTLRPNGDMNIVGNYNITQGSYTFTFQNVIRRDFSIEPGSVINFAGDVMDARFNISAVYTVDASVYELVSQQVTGDENLSRLARERLPVNVRLNLTGTIEEPQIAFKLEVPDLQQQTAAMLITSRIDQINQDETELHKQVFSVLLFNRFVTDEGTLAGGGGNPTSAVYRQANQTVGKFFTEQLNRVTGKYIEGLTLDVGLETRQSLDDAQADYWSTTDLNVGLKQQLFSERVTLRVGGEFGLAQEQSMAGEEITGDFMVEYRLDPRGRIQLRAFRLSDYDILEEENRYRNGIGISFKKSFDKISNFFGRKENDENAGSDN